MQGKKERDKDNNLEIATNHNALTLFGFWFKQNAKENHL